MVTGDVRRRGLAGDVIFLAVMVVVKQASRGARRRGDGAVEKDTGRTAKREDWR